MSLLLRIVFRTWDAVLLERQQRSGTFGLLCRPYLGSFGHQLHVRRGDLPSKGNPDLWTAFEMTLREASPIPPAFDLMRFLASSITFMVYLNDVSVFFDDHRIGHLTKSAGAARVVNIPKGLKKSSGLNIMRIQTIQSHGVYIILHAIV